MSEEQIEIPSAFLKLEKLRARHIRYFAQRRQLQDRINDIRSSIVWHENRIRELRPHEWKDRGIQAPGATTAIGQVKRNERAIAVYRALLGIAERELEDVEIMVEDARLFESLRRHLQSELAAWGLE